MDRKLFFLFLFAALVCIPVAAVSVEDDVNASDVVTTAAPTADPGVPLADEEGTEAVLEASEDEAGISALADDGSLSGGYYFVADCALGYGLKFYVPIEWAHDAFALDSSGAPVNMSTSTCYAYCPDFPDYTISCSRFGSWTYRATNYTTTDLEISEIKETNISFLDDEASRPSDSEVLLLIAALIFAFGALFLITRR